MERCKFYGRHVAEWVHACFHPEQSVYVFRDIGPEVEEIYFGKAADISSLSNYTVIDLQYDSYYDRFHIEVK